MPPKGTKKTTTEAKSAKTGPTPGAKPKQLSPTKTKESEKFFETEDIENKFLQWFWRGSNGNNLIKKLNAFAQKSGDPKIDDRIRREKESPVVYCVVLNHGGFPFKEKEGKQWKLCKVGFTHRHIKKDQENRMTEVCAKIESKYGEINEGAKATTLFALRIGAVDTTPFHDTEKRIREKVGTPVRKQKAKKLRLPYSTEWVLTTQEHIDAIIKWKNKKIEEVEESGEGDVMDFFKEFKDTPTPPADKYKEWLDVKKK